MINPPYYDSYIDLVRDNDILFTLDEQMNFTYAFLATIPENKADYAYAEGKWTIKEIIGHLIDAERVFVYRATRFARKDKTDLPGFEENDYVENANFSTRTLKDLAEELLLLRKSNMYLFNSFTDEIMKRTGTANGGEISVEAILYIIAGHQKHHLKVINDRYLN
ncbi:MAG: DinB family protein [Ignavibacteriae bacterium]|nr:DinB family protein [Ignavibacteriota bacterium]